jgi:xylulokinase
VQRGRSVCADTEYETLTMMRSPVDGLFLPLAYIDGGGMCIRWFRDTLTGNPPAIYDQL